MNHHSKRIYLSPPHMSGAELKYVEEAFASNWVAPLGPHVDAFEREIAEFTGARGAAALSSGTAAIHLALRLLGVGRSDVVFCSSLTFIASANPILYEGAIPVFIDSEPESWNMSPLALKKALQDADRKGQLPKAIVIVSVYGQSADMHPLMDLCRPYEIPVIEDAAESLGATYHGKASGTFGKFGIFSFNGNKIITTSGGGMLVSEDLRAVERVKLLSTQAREPGLEYAHIQVGFNYRLSNVLAGIGRGQLKVLSDRIRRKREIFNQYVNKLSSFPGVSFMPEAAYGQSNRWLTALTVDRGKFGVTAVEIIQRMSQENIEARLLWKPMHRQPLFQGALYYPHDHRSVSDELFDNGLCLPSGTNLSDEEFDRVCQTFSDCHKPS